MAPPSTRCSGSAPRAPTVDEAAAALALAFGGTLAPAVDDAAPTTATAPAWLPELAHLVAEQPDAAAFTLAIRLDPDGRRRITGAQVRPWLDRLRA